MFTYFFMPFSLSFSDFSEYKWISCVITVPMILQGGPKNTNSRPKNMIFKLCRLAVWIRCSANTFELIIWKIRNPLLSAKPVDPQPAVSRSIIAYNWLVSWHVWGVRNRTGSHWWVRFGKASLFGARRDSNVSSVKNQTKVLKLTKTTIKKKLHLRQQNQ